MATIFLDGKRLIFDCPLTAAHHFEGMNPLNSKSVRGRLSRGLQVATMLTAATFGSVAMAQEKVVFPAERWETATPHSQGVDPQRLDQALDYVRSISGNDGVGEVVIVRNGYVLWQGDQVGRPRLVWSCTKSYLSVCLGILWDDGLCAPGDLASKYIPALKAKYPDVTLEHLATFTSGYASEEHNVLKPLDPMYAPGAAFHYSSQSDLLAAVLTKIAGQSLEDLFFERIGKPIGITREDMDWGEVTEVDGVPINGGAGFLGSGVRINASGMARFGWLMANHGMWNGKRLLSERYIRYATVPRTSPSTPPHDPKGWYVSLPGNYGLNWWTNGPLPDGKTRWPSVPTSTFAAQGNRNNNCFVIPEWNMVIVRLGGDKIIGMELYDRMFELLKPAK